MRADRTQAHQVLRAHPGLLDRLTDKDRAAIVEAADDGNTEAVRLMLELGFAVDTRGGDDGCSPLHAASFRGSVDLVRLLIDAGADLEALDATWHSTPLVSLVPFPASMVAMGLPPGRHRPNHSEVKLNPHISPATPLMCYLLERLQIHQR